MATFAKASYNAAAYNAFRPTYPPSLYSRILAYHNRGSTSGSESRRGKIVDLGCGTGQATLVWKEHFKEILGVDPSAGMLEQAKERAINSLPSNDTAVEFQQSAAEELSFVTDSSVDLVSAAQACHWFDYPKVWNELARVLKPSGTIAFWGYGDFRLRGYDSTIPLVEEFINGRSELSVGPYWQQPGRERLRRLFTTIPTAPPSKFHDFELIHYVGKYWNESQNTSETINTPTSSEPIVMNQTLTWDGLESYLRTWSAVATFLQKNPDMAGKKGLGIDGDVVDRFIVDLKAAVQAESDSLPETIVIDSCLALLLYRRNSV